MTTSTETHHNLVADYTRLNIIHDELYKLHGTYGQPLRDVQAQVAGMLELVWERIKVLEAEAQPNE